MTDPASSSRLEPARLLAGAQLLVIGGTGFLGKIFWVMLLDRYPELGRIYLVVRSSKALSSEERFWAQIATSPVLDCLRARYGEGFEAFLREKVVPVDGDLSRPDCGLNPALLEALSGKVTAVVNVAGVVDFNPPLDEALNANAFGAKEMVSVARKLGSVPVMHTSTCYVAGKRKGPIDEVDPCTYPFPRCDELDPSLWDPEREIAECLDLVAQARHRGDDAFRQSEMMATAKRNLLSRGEPTEGEALSSEVASVKRKFISKRLIDAGLERAKHWGWPNIYTYTKSIGEQVVARSGLRFTIVRPACSESCEAFPMPGWNEGVNTSSPLIYLSLKGLYELPGADTPLDFIPADMVCAGMILSLLELLDGTEKAVYQYGTSDINPVNASRIGELIGLYKRKYYQRREEGSALGNFLQAHYEPEVIPDSVHKRLGPSGFAKAAKAASKLLGKAAVGPVRGLLKPAARSLEAMAAEQAKIGEIIDLFAPFTAHPNGPFSCANTRAAYARLSGEDREKLPWKPETVDWRHWMHEVHMPGFEKWVLPEMDRRRQRPERPLRPHRSLVRLLAQMAERHDRAVALSRTEPEGLSRITYQELWALSGAAAERLALAGCKPGDRVVLCAHNHPDWVVAFFGALRAGATVVPFDASLEAPTFVTLTRQSGARLAVVDDKARQRVSAQLAAELPEVRLLDLPALAAEGPGPSAVEPDVSPDHAACLIYTSGTTSKPKGVVLTHANFTSLVGSLARVFPIGSGDRVLSVLPLHHTFELTCGLLLPLSRGARVVYLDELSGERLGEALRAGRITAMVGVPALWQLLERKILAEVRERGPAAETAFKITSQLNLTLGRKLGVDAGRLLFGRVHEALGGNVRYLISGGAALPEGTHGLFASLGLHLTEGYGLTEASPVLTVAKPSPKSRPGHVGKPVPGVEIKIDAPDPGGVGEVLARGPNVMKGYEGDAEATSAALGPGGWLRTGDLGKIDSRGQLSIVGRAKDVVVTATGENVYPDDVERTLGDIDGVAELVVLGVEAPQGGERLALVAVPSGSSDEPGREARAEKALGEAVRALPSRMQPSIVEVWSAPLPRTSTRKVKRGEVSAMLARRLEARAAARAGAGAGGARGRVAAAIAAVSGRPASEISPHASLAGDLGFDSLMLVELHAALASSGPRLPEAELAACRTVADIEALLDEASGPVERASEGESDESSQVDEGPAFELPSLVREAGKALLGQAQKAFYERAMRPKVYGRAFIPHDRPTIVVANHASHLDMGLVKHALGSYGEGIVALAAQDYFFEEGTLRRAYVENLTNLRAIDRRSGAQEALRQAGEVLAEGKTVLVFPEGTRSDDGVMGEFKALVGHLALEHERDILPVYLEGTHEALPKGAALPQRRAIVARIGPVLEASELRRLTAGLGWADAAREAARLAERAVRALGEGEVLELRRLPSLSASKAGDGRGEGRGGGPG